MTSSSAELHAVTKGFGRRHVFQQLTFAFAPSTSYIIRGPSGYGKSTLLNLLAGYVQPDAGRVISPASTGYILQDEMLFSATNGKRS